MAVSWQSDMYFPSKIGSGQPQTSRKEARRHPSLNPSMKNLNAENRRKFFSILSQKNTNSDLFFPVSFLTGKSYSLAILYWLLIYYSLSPARIYSEFSFAIFDMEISFGQTDSQACVFVQLPNPSLSIWATIFNARDFRSGSPWGRRAR